MTPSSAQHVPHPPWTVALRRGLRDRANWVMFALGLGTGIPIGWAWYNLPWTVTRGAYPVENSLAGAYFDFTAYSMIYLAALVVAPWLDRWPAPFFRRLGHRRSWVVSSLSAALVLTGIFVAIMSLLPMATAEGFAQIYGYFAFIVVGVLFAAVLAFRIQLRPGREQAMAFGAQYLGATIGQYAALLGGETGLSYPHAGVVALLLCLAIWAVARFAEPEPPRMGADAFARVPPLVPPPLVPFEFAARTIADPWRAFFRRHGRGSTLMLAALAFFGAAIGGALFLGAAGIAIGLEAPRDQEAIDRMANGVALILPFGIIFMLAGLVAGIAVSLARPAPQAFRLLQNVIIAFAVLFLVCKLASGSIGLSAATMALASTLLEPFYMVILAVVLARLTAGPHIAGQALILIAFATLPRLSSGLLYRVASEIGTLGLAAFVIVMALAALFCMWSAEQIARQPVVSDVPQSPN
jgi:hypothetical protein